MDLIFLPDEFGHGDLSSFAVRFVQSHRMLISRIAETANVINHWKDARASRSTSENPFRYFCSTCVEFRSWWFLNISFSSGRVARRRKSVRPVSWCPFPSRSRGNVTGRCFDKSTSISYRWSTSDPSGWRTSPDRNLGPRRNRCFEMDLQRRSTNKSPMNDLLTSVEEILIFLEELISNANHSRANRLFQQGFQHSNQILRTFDRRLTPDELPHLLDRHAIGHLFDF